MREREVTPGTDGQHPDIDQWIAYHGGELPDSEEQSLRGHLAKCPACVSLMLDLEAFARPGEEDRAKVSEFEMAAAWRAVKAGLREAPARRRGPAPMALAASLAAGALGLSLWALELRHVNELRETVNELSQPQLNLSIRDLEPNMATRSGGTPNATEVPRDSFSALVMLPSEAFASYEVEIVDGDGQVVWASPGLAPNAELGTLTVGLPPGYLEPGSYRVRLHGQHGDERIPLPDDLPIRALP